MMTENKDNMSDAEVDLVQARFETLLEKFPELFDMQDKWDALESYCREHNSIDNFSLSDLDAIPVVEDSTWNDERLKYTESNSEEQGTDDTQDVDLWDDLADDDIHGSIRISENFEASNDGARVDDTASDMDFFDSVNEGIADANTDTVEDTGTDEVVTGNNTADDDIHSSSSSFENSNTEDIVPENGDMGIVKQYEMAYVTEDYEETKKVSSNTKSFVRCDFDMPCPICDVESSPSFTNYIRSYLASIDDSIRDDCTTLDILQAYLDLDSSCLRDSGNHLLFTQWGTPFDRYGEDDDPNPTMFDFLSGGFLNQSGEPDEEFEDIETGETDIESEYNDDLDEDESFEEELPDSGATLFDRLNSSFEEEDEDSEEEEEFSDNEEEASEDEDELDGDEIFDSLEDVDVKPREGIGLAALDGSVYGDPVRSEDTLVFEASMPDANDFEDEENLSDDDEVYAADVGTLTDEDTEEFEEDEELDVDVGTLSDVENEETEEEEELDVDVGTLGSEEPDEEEEEEELDVDVGTLSSEESEEDEDEEEFDTDVGTLGSEEFEEDEDEEELLEDEVVLSDDDFDEEEEEFSDSEPVQSADEDEDEDTEDEEFDSTDGSEFEEDEDSEDEELFESPADDVTELSEDDFDDEELLDEPQEDVTELSEDDFDDEELLEGTELSDDDMSDEEEEEFDEESSDEEEFDEEEEELDEEEEELNDEEEESEEEEEEFAEDSEDLDEEEEDFNEEEEEFEEDSFDEEELSDDDEEEIEEIPDEELDDFGIEDENAEFEDELEDEEEIISDESEESSEEFDNPEEDEEEYEDAFEEMDALMSSNSPPPRPQQSAPRSDLDRFDDSMSSSPLGNEDFGVPSSGSGRSTFATPPRDENEAAARAVYTLYESLKNSPKTLKLIISKLKGGRN